MQDERDEIKMLLRKNLELTRENNKLIKRIRRGAVIGFILKLVFWAIVIGLPIYLYYAFLQPSIEELITAIQGVQSGVESSRDNLQNALQNLPFIGNLLESELATTTESVVE